MTKAMTKMGPGMVEAIDEGRARDAVARVWREELPLLPFDEALTWRDGGVDSLKSLLILLRLEKLLGRAISFDLFTLDSRLGEVIRLLGGGAPAPFADAPAVRREPLFVLPGIKGDDRNLADFRRSLASEVRVETLDYPGMDVPAKAHGDLDLQTDLIIREIGRRQPDGPICVAGYSFGGFMAFEVARRLADSGRQIGLVVLLDTFTGPARPGGSDLPAVPRKRYPILPRLAGRPGEGLRGYLERLAFQMLVKYRRLEAARRLANGCAGRTDIEQNDGRRRRMLELMRARALRRWRPRALAAPVLLITSDDYHDWSNAEVWPALCPDLTVRHVGGSHMDIFRPAALATINAAILSGLARLDRRAPITVTA
jgi:thioesterase domain-containing protein/acyl carrier protein